MTAERVFVALGANLGSPAEQLDAAVAALAEIDGVRVVGVSSWHRTAPVGGPAGQPMFLNGVVELATTLEPERLLSAMQAIEARFGRRRVVKDGPRTLDLDLLCYGDRRMATGTLVLPHPRMEDRRFVLAPLAELAPDLVLARSGLTVRERLDALPPG